MKACLEASDNCANFETISVLTLDTIIISISLLSKLSIGLGKLQIVLKYCGILVLNEIKKTIVSLVYLSCFAKNVVIIGTY